MKKFSYLILFFTISFVQLSAQCPNFSRPGIHVVKSGENLYRIAKLYNLALNDLVDWNNVFDNTTLYECQELVLSNSGNFGNNYTEPSDYLTERAGNNNNIDNNYRKQSGGKHLIQKGETISGLARLYGYTAERFRQINLLKQGEELSVGSIILSTDCACNRIMTYDEFNNGNNPNYFVNNNNNSNNFQNRGNDYGVVYDKPQRDNTSSNNYGNNNNFQNRGNDYDAFYDTPQGNYTSSNNYENNNTPPPAEPIGDQIRSVNTPQSYNNNSSSNANIGSINKASATYMTSEELSMLDEINLVRSNPSGYIPYIEQYKKDILSGKSFGSSIAVCDELIAELRRTPTLSILKPVPCIYTAAKKHGLDQKSRGSTGHDGTDGSWPWDRVKRECSQMTDGNENLVGGPSSVREGVILLLVDDGISSRGHRKTMLNKDWVYGACYKVGKVGYMPNCWVQQFGY